ncbi:MAG TPA: glycosyltransferase family 2 protein [Burkholderiaceae bacterium]|nr:glycosyltransferase family 2 protein [Burkholderiaceae bacterium]
MPLSGSDRAHRHKPPSIVCVLPCYNEAANLRLLLPRLTGFLGQHFLAWDVVLVDDGSHDDTSAVLEEWTRRPGVRAVQLSRNFGKEAALSAGLDEADAEVTVLLDADLQHPPELILTMVERWVGGADVVYAVRSDRADEGAFKRVGTRLFYRMVNHGDRFDIPADAGDFRLMDRRVVEALRQLPERNRFMKGLYAWVGFRAEGVPYQPARRAAGRTHFSIGRLLRLSIDGLTGFTTWPLRVVSVVGAITSLMAFVYGGYLTVRYLLLGNDVPGWTTVVVLLLLFAGIQMIAMGMVGEYIARIFEEVKARPRYLVRRRLGHQHDNKG